MANKKRRNKERTQGIILTIVAVVVSVGIIGASVISSSVGLFYNWVVKVDNEKVTKKQYETFLYQQKSGVDQMFQDQSVWDPQEDGSSMGDYAKQSVLESLTQNKIRYNKAVEAGVTLTDEEKEEVEESVANAKTAIGEEAIKKLDVSDELLNEYYTEIALADKMYDEATADYEFDQADFDGMFKTYYNENIVSLTDMKGDYIVTDTKEEAEEVNEKLARGEEFTLVMEEHSVDYDAENADTYESIKISTSSLPEEVVNEAYKLLPGDFSRIIEVSNDDTSESKFYIVQLTEKTDPDEEEEKEIYKETYITNKKQEIFQEKYAQWEEEAKIEMNSIAIQKIDITKIAGGAKTPGQLAAEEIAAEAEETADTGEENTEAEETEETETK